MVAGLTSSRRATTATVSARALGTTEDWCILWYSATPRRHSARAYISASCVLSSTLSLHGIRDVDAFCVTIVRKYDLGGLPSYVREDLHAYLVSRAWELSLTYQPGKITFATWAGNKLRHAGIDWLRAPGNGGRPRTIWRFRDGRVHERRAPVFVSLDDDDARLGELVAPLSGDPETDSDTLVRGLQLARDRCRAGDLELLRPRARRRAR